MQQRREKISVIIPVYNVALWLSACLQSVLAQTFTDLEIIAVNDGSTDHSARILEQFSQQDKRLKIITQTNQGPSAARAAGVSAATGDFLAFLDGDDLLPPDYFEKLYRLHLQTGADLALAPMWRFVGEEQPTPREEQTILFAQDRVLSGKEKQLIWEDSSAAMALCGKLISRSLAGKIDWFISAYKSSDDIFPSVQLLALARQIAVSSQTAYYYRQNRADSQSQSASHRFSGLFDGFLRARKFLEQSGNYDVCASGFEYIRRVCLLSFIEKYGLTKEEEKLVVSHRDALYVSKGIFRTRPLKFRLRQKLFDFCLRFNLSYEVMSNFVRKLSFRI